jgi:hypothetical protein
MLLVPLGWIDSTFWRIYIDFFSDVDASRKLLFSPFLSYFFGYLYLYALLDLLDHAGLDGFLYCTILEFISIVIISSVVNTPPI